jgi:2-polyprenyl-3-methyl-5-hydroxy-6-metoxy-1,4-benzoquinol methylase
MKKNNDKAGKKYWNESWDSSATPTIVDPDNNQLKNYTNKKFNEVFQQIFDKNKTPSMSLLEIGCASSVWLPYFSKEFGFSVSGIDYSPPGCEIAQKILHNCKIDGDIVCADFFFPPKEMIASYDVVVSFGVVEHFEDSVECLKAFSLFLKPGGILITNIPNMVGCIGALQKIINKPVYDIHKLIDQKQLQLSHELAGFKIVKCEYFMSTGFGVNNLAGLHGGTISWFMKKIIIGIFSRFSMFIWLIESRINQFPTSKFLSPYINCISIKLN